MSMPTPPAAQPLYPHNVSAPTVDPEATPEAVNVDAICELFDRSMGAHLYLDRVLTDEDRQALFDQHQLVSELDAVRGVDVVRRATDDEIAVAEAAKEAETTPPTTRRRTSTADAAPDAGTATA